MRIVKGGGRKFEKSERKRINKTGTCAMNPNTTNKKNLQYMRSLHIQTTPVHTFRISQSRSVSCAAVG